ncbi:hypothetical protein AK812_SmicGene44068 [Symbiodinium microadriaticum]|uniref:Uncharacterized protein n=1 Tax=Symbiodinium microadriaticum TaxID=2951 RepID=A0A1Q9BZE6_SYMMI|nr:hypothetical protein AK812_SmicGene44068 [Symbiodinium microadriaticum]
MSPLSCTVFFQHHFQICPTEPVRDEFAFAAVVGEPKPDPLDPVAVAAAAPPPEQELTSIGPAPEVPAARAASGESHRFRLVNFHKFLRESWVDALRDITMGPGENWGTDGNSTGTGRELGGNWTGTGRELGRELGRNWTGTGRELDGNWEGTGTRTGKELDGNWEGTGRGTGRELDGNSEGTGRELGRELAGTWRKLAGTWRELGGNLAELGGNLAGTWRELGGKWRELGGNWRKLGGNLAGTGGNLAGTGGNLAGTWRELGGKLGGNLAETGGNLAETRRELGRNSEGTRLERMRTECGGLKNRSWPSDPCDFVFFAANSAVSGFYELRKYRSGRPCKHRLGQLFEALALRIIDLGSSCPSHCGGGDAGETGKKLPVAEKAARLSEAKRRLPGLAIEDELVQWCLQRRGMALFMCGYETHKRWVSTLLRALSSDVHRVKPNDSGVMEMDKKMKQFRHVPRRLGQGHSRASAVLMPNLIVTSNFDDSEIPCGTSAAEQLAVSNTRLLIGRTDRADEMQILLDLVSEHDRGSPEFATALAIAVSATLRPAMGKQSRKAIEFI